jgi:hypothetical protein
MGNFLAISSINNVRIIIKLHLEILRTINISNIYEKPWIVISLKNKKWKVKIRKLGINNDNIEFKQTKYYSNQQKYALNGIK